jgi:hypothetical protein
VDPYYRPRAAALLAHAYAMGHRIPEARAQLAYARAHEHDVDSVDLAAAAELIGDRPGRATAGHSRLHVTLYT